MSTIYDNLADAAREEVKLAHEVHGLLLDHQKVQDELIRELKEINVSNFLNS